MKPYTYRFFTPRELKPEGWLRKQLILQAEGLAGNLDKIWPDVRNSMWIGGDREGWERVPYWLDGFIPLVYLLNDTDGIARAKHYIDSILDSQCEDGWICPCTEAERGHYDTWAVLLISKVLTVYAECSGEEERIVKALSRCLWQFNAFLNYHTLHDWGAARWFEGLIAIFWLYERTGEEWLLTLAKNLAFQGFDWKKIFENDEIAAYSEGWDYYSHVVNIAMALKSEALMSCITGGDPESFAKTALAYLEKHHGNAYGHFNGDECLHGSSPLSGSELCGVVEAMYSYELLFAVTGNTEWLDRLEALAFNGLPATVSPDMWTHQYNQMTNQIRCERMDTTIFRTNAEDSHTFGLEPNYGCCTANMGQGWPKLAMTAIMGTEEGIALCLPVPMSLETTVKGVPVRIRVESEYPFRPFMICTVDADAPVTFELAIRIPRSACRARIAMQELEPGAIVRIPYQGPDPVRISVTYLFETQMHDRPKGLKCVTHGPLLFALPVQEEKERIEYERDGVPRRYPYCDYAIRPTSPWNYAFGDGELEVEERDYDIPFSPEAPPLVLKGYMHRIPWEEENGHCKELPILPIRVESTEAVELIPYGCTTLRMTEMPRIGQETLIELNEEKNK